MGKSTASGKQRDDQLKMKQCSLILGVLSTLSGFHYECGDTRLLDDLVQRDREAWLPRVGTEYYGEFQDAQTSHSISWKAFTSDFVTAFPEFLPKDAEAQKTLAYQLRSQLRHNLEQMSQLPDWPQKSFLKPLQQFVCADLTGGMNAWLVLYSSAVITSGDQSGSKLWNTQNRDWKQLAEFLDTSCLFSKPLTAKSLTTTSLQDCIQKLKSLFCGQGDEQVNSREPIYVVAFYVCEANDDAFIEHFRRLPCLATIGRNVASEPEKWLYRCILEKEKSSITEDDLTINNKQRPAHSRAFDSCHQAVKCWENVVGESQEIIDHRCPKPVPRGGNRPEEEQEAIEVINLYRLYIP
ncbi:hypothetical protein LTS17_012826 [Exophiala oligosperma]